MKFVYELGDVVPMLPAQGWYYRVVSYVDSNDMGVHHDKPLCDHLGNLMDDYDGSIDINNKPKYADAMKASDAALRYNYKLRHGTTHARYSRRKSKTKTTKRSATVPRAPDTCGVGTSIPKRCKSTTRRYTRHTTHIRKI